MNKIILENKKKYKIFICLLFIIFIFIFFLKFYQIGYTTTERIGGEIGNTTIEINKFNTCRNIINLSNNDILIPIRTEKEWYKFIRSAHLKNIDNNNIAITYCSICNWVGCINSPKNLICKNFDIGLIKND